MDTSCSKGGGTARKDQRESDSTESAALFRGEETVPPTTLAQGARELVLDEVARLESSPVLAPPQIVLQRGAATCGRLAARELWQQGIATLKRGTAGSPTTVPLAVAPSAAGAPASTVCPRSTLRAHQEAPSAPPMASLTPRPSVFWRRGVREATHGGRRRLDGARYSRVSYPVPACEARTSPSRRTRPSLALGCAGRAAA
jgi:hypothetical protein